VFRKNPWRLRVPWWRVAGALCVLLPGAPAPAAQGNAGGTAAGSKPPSEVTVPRVPRPPRLEDFLGMAPSQEMAGRMARVEGFVQSRPTDGGPASQRTEAYLGYDQVHFYVVFVCHDSEPHKIRARLVAREQFVSNRGEGIDDLVSISLDTFGDQRRGYTFQISPLGIQWDALITDSGSFDVTYDTLWHSQGKVTESGYVVWVALPFKSLRFASDAQQNWGILLNRDIPRSNEAVFWPQFTSRISGYINQAAPLRGLENISPGRNLQFIPYGAFRSFRALDLRDPLAPAFRNERAEFDGGLDAKVVVKDSLVLDVTLNPDFSQVESDEPQLVVSERFEVFFPEKRPFFIENAGYFRTPNNLLFTRRIADPQFGARLTGKLGRTAVGALLVDDQAPGRRVPRGHPQEDQRALFGILRVNRDILSRSSVGMVFTNRSFDGGYNRVGGLDARFQINDNWSANMQAAASSTRSPAGAYLAGPAYDFEVRRDGRQFEFEFEFFDRSPGFRTEPGFLPRTDIRQFEHTASYRFRPEGRYLISWGPSAGFSHVWNHAGTQLNWEADFEVTAELIGQTFLTFLFNPEMEKFTPLDFPALAQDRAYHRHNSAVFWNTNYWRQVGFSGEFVWGQRVNLDPVAGTAPEKVNRTQADLTVTLRPLNQLKIDNSYLLFRLVHPANGLSLINNHIIRSKWNWQFTRELSLRLIFQYDALLANQVNTSLETTKNFNADLLITYLLNPGTALYVGYNSNLQNADILPCAPASGCATQLRRASYFINDAKGLFVKFSYLFRF